MSKDDWTSSKTYSKKKKKREKKWTENAISSLPGDICSKHYMFYPAWPL